MDELNDAVIRHFLKKNINFSSETVNVVHVVLCEKLIIIRK